MAAGSAGRFGTRKAGVHGWNENKHRFNRALRWRMGQPYGPAALFDCLRSKEVPTPSATATYEELVVRYWSRRSVRG